MEIRMHLFFLHLSVLVKINWSSAFNITFHSHFITLLPSSCGDQSCGPNYILILHYNFITWGFLLLGKKSANLTFDLNFLSCHSFNVLSNCFSYITHLLKLSHYLVIFSSTGNSICLCNYPLLKPGNSVHFIHVT